MILYTNCLRCGRELKDTKAQQRGMGAKCAKKAKEAAEKAKEGADGGNKHE